MQEASVLKPYALSLLLLPSADKLFSCQWAILHSLTRKILVSACQNRKKLSVLTRVLLVRQWNLKLFPENLYFSIPLTSEILVSNRKLQPFTAILFGFWHVFILSLHDFSSYFGKPDKEFACQLIILWMVDKQEACQCSFSIHWEEKNLSVQFFDTLRRKKLVS